MKFKLFPVIICCLGLFLAFPAGAQITQTARIELTDAQPVVRLGGNIYVTQDPENRLSAEVVGMRHENNLRGVRQENRIINLGLSSTPSWLVFSVTNNSSTEDWVLHFGDLLSGRMGLARKLMVINQTTRQAYTEAMRGANVGGFGQDLEGPAVPVKIGKNKTELFVVFAEMEEGFPATLVPSLMTEKAYLDSLSLDPTPAFFLVFFIAVSAAFVTIGYLFRDLSYLLFAGYFAAHCLVFFLLGHLFFARFAFSGEILSFLASIAILWSLALTRMFLGITVEQHMENSVLFFVACLVTVATLASFFILDKRSAVDEALVFIPHGVAALVMAALAYQQGQHGRPGGLFYAAGWLVFLLGLLITASSAAGLISLNTFNMDAFWLALLPQAAFFMAAARKKIEVTQIEERHLMARESRAAQSLARLKQSKESADQARLLRVIERERELMTELREREIQRTDEMRKAKETADHANQAKSAFLAVVSHEIRTPMNGIMGIVRLFRDTKMSKDQSDYMLAIQKSGDTMMALLDDILDFEKIETGNMELEYIDFDLPRLVQGVVTLMSGHAATKNITLKHDIPSDFPRYLAGDPTRLRQVLLNLVSNAIKFTDRGGVTIRLRAVKLDESKPAAIKGDYEINIAVEDTGIGISDAVQEKLFTPFQQASSSTARKYGGTGLGLAICLRLVEAMGGAIRVNSQSGTGSTFHFTILMEKAKSTPAEEGEITMARLPRSAAPPMSVLVIEDNEINRKVMRNFLEKDGHRVTDSENGDNAADLCTRNKFDVVLLDINLNGISGFEVIKIIRALPDRKKAAVPVIAITGNAGERDIEEIQDSGFDDYLAKPVDFDRLMRMLGDIHAGKYAEDMPSPQAMKKADAPAAPTVKPPPPKPRPKAGDEDRTAPIHEFLRKMDEEEDMEEFDSFAEAVTIAAEAEKAAADGAVPAVFDEKLMKGLLASLGRAQVVELMKGFVEKADEIVAALDVLAKNPDAQEINARAHELKGMAANFGINELSAIARAIENAAKSGNLEAAVAEIKKLSEANLRARTAILKWLE